MSLIEATARSVKNIIPYSGWESYDNPRLKNDGLHYLTPDHIYDLKDGSEILWETDLGEEAFDGIGTLRRFGITTQQGYSYAAIVGIPEKPESTVPIIGTSAWFTSTEGHNEHTVRNMMRAGNYVFFVGSEGSFEPDEKTTPSSPITLANSAAAVLNFAYHAAEGLNNEDYGVDLEKRAVIGESRGAMTAMGILALATEFGQVAVTADITAPCLPKAMKWADIRELSGQILVEPKEIAKLIGNLTLARLIHYPATLDLSPYNLKHQLAIGFALFSGEAGALAKHVPEEQLLHITTFESDFASMHHEWEKIFKNHANVRITPLPGGHLTLADLETLKFIIGRNKAAQICLADNKPLTPKSVFDAAHMLAPKQNPLPVAV